MKKNGPENPSAPLRPEVFPLSVRVIRRLPFFRLGRTLAIIDLSNKEKFIVLAYPGQKGLIRCPKPLNRCGVVLFSAPDLLISARDALIYAPTALLSAPDVLFRGADALIDDATSLIFQSSCSVIKVKGRDL